MDDQPELHSAKEELARQEAERDKLVAVIRKDKSRIIGEFLDWLAEEKGYLVVEPVMGEWVLVTDPIEQLLAEFFEFAPSCVPAPSPEPAGGGDGGQILYDMPEGPAENKPGNPGSV